MISSEVQRTLVKSPPELWAELSDPASLARHLGELGEIRITRMEPERRVEWKTEGTTGTVVIKPSGWGTKVTLSVTREVHPGTLPTAEEAEAATQAEDIAEPEAEAKVEADAGAVEADAPRELAASAEMETATIEAETAEGELAEIESGPAPESRRGFFARLFGRRKPQLSRPTEPTLEQEPSLEALQPSIAAEGVSEKTAAEEAEPLSVPTPIPSAIESLQARFQGPEPLMEAADEQASEPEDEGSREPSSDLAAELKAAEEVAVEEVTAVLTAVLDRLGAAHHRPFSRA